MSELEQVSKNSLQSLQSADFLSSEDIEFIQNNFEYSKEQLEKRTIWRDEVDMRVSVLNDRKHPTKAAKYWQANREYSVFYEQLILLNFEYEETEIDLEELEEKLLETDGFEHRRLQIEKKRTLYKKKNQQLAFKDRLRELKLWKKIMTELDDGTFNTQDSSVDKAKSLITSDLLHVYQVETKEIAMSQGEMANLYGRTQTGLRYAEENGFFNDLINVLPDNVQDVIMGSLGYKLAEGQNG